MECEEEFDADLIEARAIIKQLICDGDIEGATRAINDLNPEVSNSSDDSESRYWTEMLNSTSNLKSSNLYNSSNRTKLRRLSSLRKRKLHPNV